MYYGINHDILLLVSVVRNGQLKNIINAILTHIHVHVIASCLEPIYIYMYWNEEEMDPI